MVKLKFGDLVRWHTFPNKAVVTMVLTDKTGTYAVISFEEPLRLRGRAKQQLFENIVPIAELNKIGEIEKR